MAVRVTVLTMLLVTVAVVAGLPGARRGSLAAWAAGITGTLLQAFLWYSGVLPKDCVSRVLGRDADECCA